MIWALLIVSVICIVCGYFGPEDGGTLEGVGLILLGIVVWKSWAKL